MKIREMCVLCSAAIVLYSATLLLVDREAPNAVCCVNDDPCGAGYTCDFLNGDPCDPDLPGRCVRVPIEGLVSDLR